MPSIMDLPEAYTVYPNGQMVFGTGSSTYQISPAEVYYEALTSSANEMLAGSNKGFNLIFDDDRGTKQDYGYSTAVYHRSHFRGKYMGATITNTQLGTKMYDGIFGDVWIGDYWCINDVIWRVADFDYYYRKDNDTTEKRGELTHHIVLVNDIYGTESYSVLNKISTASSFSGSTYQGYGFSATAKDMAYQINQTAGDSSTTSTPYADIHAACSGSSYDIWKHCNVVNTGYTRTTKGVWFSAVSLWNDRYADCLNEWQLFGTAPTLSYRETRYATRNMDCNYRESDDQQLALFRLAPEYISGPAAYVIRDPWGAGTGMTMLEAHSGRLIEYTGAGTVNTRVAVALYQSQFTA